SAGVGSAVVWQNGAIIDLDPQKVHGNSWVTDLTNPPPGHEGDVQVVGYMQRSDNRYNVFLGVGGAIYDTSILWGHDCCGRSLAISDSGVVAGGYGFGGDFEQPHAYVWNDSNQNHIADQGELNDLHSLFPDATKSVAEDIIDPTSTVPHSQIVANAYVPVAGSRNWRAYLLTDQGDNGFNSGVEVTPLGTMRGSGLTVATAINNAGQIAGDSGGDAFRWQAPNGPFTNI